MYLKLEASDMREGLSHSKALSASHVLREKHGQNVSILKDLSFHLAQFLISLDKLLQHF